MPSCNHKRLTKQIFVKDWVPNSGAEDYVVSANITATKPVHNTLTMNAPIFRSTAVPHSLLGVRLPSGKTASQTCEDGGDKDKAVQQTG
jgi:hypothetical protein